MLLTLLGDDVQPHPCQLLPLYALDVLNYAPNSAFFFFLFPLALEEHSLSSPEEEATKAG